MQAVKREALGITSEELQDAYRDPALATDVPLLNPVTQVEEPTNGAVRNEIPLPTIAPTPQTDNGLLILAGVGVAGLIFFSGSAGGAKKITGNPGTSWLLPGVLVGSAFLVYKMYERKKEITAYRIYLKNWVAPQVDVSQIVASQDAIEAMPDREVCDLYTIVHDYLFTGKALEAAMQARYNEIIKLYLPMLS